MDNSEIQFSQSQDAAAEVSRSFMANVFSYMFAALLISGAAAWWFGNSELINTLKIGNSLTTLGKVVMFSPLIFVLVISFGFQRLSAGLLMVLFLAYSLVTGISLSFIFLAYTTSSIVQVFGVAALMFGVMAVAGYRTSTDLTRFGSLLFMALIGLIIASLVNWFMHNSTLDYLISFGGVFIFTGLTAYDVQKLKRIGAGIGVEGSADAGKLAVLGALSLYLDFINLFLYLLRLFGRRK